jgi:hypothetical protein
MQFSPSVSGPFAVLTAIVAPAVLSSACSILTLATGNRLGRVVDRTRVLADELAGLEEASAEHKAWAVQLECLQTRARMLLKALRLFYATLGLFASAALVSVIGSIGAYFSLKFVFDIAAFLAMLSSTCAVIGLAYGCAAMVNETRLAVHNLAEEATLRMTYKRQKHKS